MIEGKAREIGLGGLSKISLADARKKAGAQRVLLVDKVDPLDRRHAESSAKKIEAARAMTFDYCAQAYLKAHEASWRNAKHRQQWKNTLATYVFPILGSVSVSDVDVAMVMKVVEPLWATKPETAAGCVVGSNGCWIGRRPGASATARTRRVGAGIYRTSCRRARRCRP
jgi:hypothetical protein